MSQSQKPKKPVEVIVFNNPAKKKTEPQGAKKRTQDDRRKRKFTPTSSSEDDKKPIFEYDQKKAKFDVRKMAIHSMKKTEKEDAMVDFLVELGAKRPKNKCLHPRDYMAQLKQRRQEEKEQQEKNGVFGQKKKRKSQKSRRDKDDLLNFVDGQKGWYKDGVQYMDSSKK